MEIIKNSLSFLIVDDDPDDRMLFIEAVKEVDESINCITANNGEQALEILKDKEKTLPDFIFLDIRMPKMDGNKCLQEIKRDERLIHIPVVIYTTSKEGEESRKLRSMGAFHFITKPKNPDEIFYLISFVMDEHSNILRRGTV